jgi:hypothetical protein
MHLQMPLQVDYAQKNKEECSIPYQMRAET